MSMPRTGAKSSLAIILFAFAVLCLPSALRAQNLPTDAIATCTVSPTDFAHWFESGTPTLNGVVKPADSLNFPDQPNCSFYQWSQQMFLWITSPSPPTYCGGGNRVFDTPVFFDVSPPDPTTFQRNFLQHNCSSLGGINRFLLVRAAKVGPHGLPVIFDKKGRMLDIEPAPRGPAGKPIVLDRQGKPVEIESIRLVQGKPVFTAKTGAVLAPRPMLKTRFNRALTVQQFMIGNRPIFLDLSGNVVETEEGQAVSNAVLMSQTGSLTYYVSITNDVFAYFLTGEKTGHINTANQFPTTPSDLSQITSFASSHGVTFPDPNALAVEIKSSWVEASTLPDASKYITTMATIPTYTKTASQWTPSSQQTVKLALVGMHVVGSTGTRGSPTGPGHPEMIWATFEHFGNQPLDEYKYNSTSGPNPKKVLRDTSGTWLFSQSNAAEPFNCEFLFQDGQNIKPTPAAPPCPAGSFTGSNSIRRKAFGAAPDVNPNPFADTPASNTDIISINKSIHTQLPAGDVRNNYFLAGATWTPLGSAPITGAEGVGTSMLAGGTMETYFQGKTPNSTSGGLPNCFNCHTSGASTHNLATTDVSHIFSALNPLIFPHLIARATPLQTTAAMHTIRVTTTNSATGAPVAGAVVTVLDADSGDEKASGTTAADGTVTLKYSRCSILLDELPNGKPPRRVFVPCDGEATAGVLGTATFRAP